MNKKGSIMLSIVIAGFIFITGILFLSFFPDVITEFRVNLQCSSSSLTMGTMLVCLITDTVVPYFLWLIASLVLGMIVGGKI